MSVQNLWGQLKNAANAGILAGGRPYARNILYVGDNAPTFGTQYNTIAAALAAMVSGDVLLLGPQAYAEGNLTIPAAASGITIVGASNRGKTTIEPVATGDEGLQVLADDVTLVNVGITKGATADYALNIKACARFRAYGCKFEGDGVCVLLDGSATDQAADVLFEDCEFAWCGSAILFDDSAYGYPTQIRIKNCWFHNYTTVGVGLAASGGVVNLELTNCVFDNNEDASAPTDYIKVDRAGDSGIVSGCRFATATNATGVLTIAAGIMWVANGTEAGWSTARPA